MTAKLENALKDYMMTGICEQVKHEYEDEDDFEQKYGKTDTLQEIVDLYSSLKLKEDYIYMAKSFIETYPEEAKELCIFFDVTLGDIGSIDEYSKAVVDIIRNQIINKHPKKLDEFDQAVADIMDCVTDNKEFRDEIISEWADIELDGDFGLCGYGVYVEVAKKYPEFKDLAKKDIINKIESRSSDEWFQIDWGEDVYNVKDEVDYFGEVYNQLIRWQRHFNTAFNLVHFNEAVASYIDFATDLELPRDEDIISLLPEDVFLTICDIRNYVPDYPIEQL